MLNASRLALVLLALLGAVLPADAQIYSWRDAKGNVVVSDHPPNGATRSYEITRRDAPFRATRAAEASAGGRYDEIIERHAATYGVSPDLVRAVMQVESAFNPYARSSKGALGLMQLMPSTAIEMGVRNPFDPEQNIRGGVAYLRQLLNKYGNDLTLALAAYNAGPTAVDRHGYQVPPYAETRKYVARVKNGTGNLAANMPARPASMKANAKNSPAAAPPRYVYKTIEIIGGRPVPKYSDTRPSTGPYEVLGRR